MLNIRGKWQFIRFLTELFLLGNYRLARHKLVVAWIEIHNEDLTADWNLAVNGKKPFQIKGIDQ